MNTFAGVGILIIVTAILAGTLFWFASTREPATLAVDDEGLYETLDISLDCSAESEADWGPCCKEACDGFCTENDLKKYKHLSNTHLCSCWCE